MAGLKKVLIGLVVLIVVLTALAFVLPAQSRVERAIVINAPTATVFAVMRDFEQFNQWSPWAELDPNTQYTYSGTRGEVGAKYEWRGNSAVGAGSQEITAIENNQSIAIHLIFEGQGDARVAYQLHEQNGTQVVWSFVSEHGFNPLNRWFGLMLDSMIGADYEKGLAKLKNYIESQPAALPVIPQMEVDPVPESMPLSGESDDRISHENEDVSDQDSAGEPPSEDDNEH